MVCSIHSFSGKIFSKVDFNLNNKYRYIGFLIGRYGVRNFIYTAMNENIYFITCYLATERKPTKVMYLL